MESTLIQPLLTNIQETFQDSISVACIHELLFKAIIDLPNCKAKTTVQQSLYEKIRKLINQSSKSNNNVPNQIINAYNKQVLDRQLKSLPNNSKDISKQLKKLVNDLMLSNESIKSELLEQKMSMDFGDKMNSKTFQSRLTFLYLNAMTAKTSDDISNLLISLLDLLLKSRSLTDSIEPVIKTKLDHLLAILVSNHSASLFSEHKYQNNLTNQDLYQSVLREYYLLTIANNIKNERKDIHPLNIYLGGNNFIACNIAYELLSSNDHSKATFLFDFFLKQSIFPLPEAVQKEETHIFFKYALVLKTMSQHYQKHNPEKSSALRMLVSKIMMIPTQVSQWISHSDQYTKDSKSMCDSVVEKLKAHNFLSLLVFVFSVDEVQRVAVLSSEKYQGEDVESMSEEDDDDVNEDAPLFSIDTQGDLKRKEQTSSAKPTFDDDDDFEVPTNNNDDDDEDDESDENSDN